MAALIIAGGVFLAEKVADKRQARKDRKHAKARDAELYRESQRETKQKLSRSHVDNSVGDGMSGEDAAHEHTDELPPPSYDEVIRNR